MSGSGFPTFLAGQLRVSVNRSVHSTGTTIRTSVLEDARWLRHSVDAQAKEELSSKLQSWKDRHHDFKAEAERLEHKLKIFEEEKGALENKKSVLAAKRRDLSQAISDARRAEVAYLARKKELQEKESEVEEESLRQNLKVKIQREAQKRIPLFQPYLAALGEFLAVQRAKTSLSLKVISLKRKYHRLHTSASQQTEQLAVLKAEAEAAAVRTKELKKECKNKLREAGEGEMSPDVIAAMQAVPDDLDELNAMIEDLKQQLAMAGDIDPNIIRDHRNRAKEIEEVTTRLNERKDALATKTADLQRVKVTLHLFTTDRHGHSKLCDGRMCGTPLLSS